MGQTGRRSLATHILAVKIAWRAAHFHGFGVARQGPWNTWVNRGKSTRAGAGTLGRLRPQQRPIAGSRAALGCSYVFGDGYSVLAGSLGVVHLCIRRANKLVQSLPTLAEATRGA
jgi:hypothetical protein